MELVMILIAPVLGAVLVKKLWTRDLYPELSEGYGENDICLVCSLRSYFACGCLVGGLVMGILMVVFSGLDIIEGNCDWMEVIMSTLLIAGTSIGFVFFMYTIMKNYALVFLKDGILYRTMSGKVYYYKDSEVIDYWQVYRKGVMIKTSNGIVNLSRMATNYDEAIRICAKYTHADATNPNA